MDRSSSILQTQVVSRSAMRLLIVLLVLICSCVHSSFAVDEHHNETATSKNEDSLVNECQHTSDYRSYIKCLKRDKRQHYGSHPGLEKGACLDECFEEKCHTSACIRDCHARCRKRLIETYSKTVETSFDCDGDTCHPVERLPNITLNVNLTNILPNVTVNCGPVEGNCTDRGKIINITNVINNVNSGPGCTYPGCNVYPYVPQPLPTITIGFNSPPIGGCPYPWPCFQQVEALPSDCSLCANPFLRQQCNPACPDAQKNPPNHAQNANSRPPPDNYYRKY